MQFFYVVIYIIEKYKKKIKNLNDFLNVGAN